MGSMRRLMDYVSKTRLIIWAVLIVTCLAMSFEASCTIWVKNGILSVEYGRCWSLVKTVRMMPVSEINSVSVACGGANGGGSVGPRSVVITNRRGGRIEFGTTLGGSAGKLDGVAYRVESLIRQSICNHCDFPPVKFFPLGIWNGVAFIIFIAGGLFYIWKQKPRVGREELC